MNHLEVLRDTSPASLTEEFRKKATGCYYTHKSIATQMFEPLISETEFVKAGRLKVFDPFAGDGRLVIWLIEFCLSNNLPKEWDVYLFDINESGLQEAERSIKRLEDKGVSITYTIKSGDAFKFASMYRDKADLVVTNPPWELLKPDSRELKQLDEDSKNLYISSMKDYDNFLSDNYPDSQPKRKFAGWGTNLSRVGAELSHLLLRNNGYCCIVLPASFFADDQSGRIRKKIIATSDLIELSYYPAEAKLFGKADVASSSLTYKKSDSARCTTKLTIFDKNLEEKSSGDFSLEEGNQDEYMIPITLGSESIKVLQKLKRDFPTWEVLEKEKMELWAGRELDETGSKNWLSNEKSGLSFVKGRMVNRFKLDDQEKLYAQKPGYSPPESISHQRIAWRDISRPSQKRRVIATIVPRGAITGNSLGVTFYRNSDETSLLSLLGIINSLCFEFQLRFYLATGHVSLSAIRKVHIPSQKITSKLTELANLCKRKVNGENVSSEKLEAIVARQVYGLNRKEFELIIDSFEKITKEEKQKILLEFEDTSMNKAETFHLIPNHLSSKLSDLDMKIVHSVPPGGNWKNIPEDIPSKRIAQIRESYIQGKGSRSTYYGRLRAEMPSYTINTYFNRPGNGCHIHYSQDRVLSQREAARLQSFPDNFEFSGPQTAVNTQIGNAVPPLLSFQIANQIKQSIGSTGVFIDLFSGAGGMGLGFKWAGWQPLLANDIESRFLDTYAKNVHGNTLCGSISDDDFFTTLVQECIKIRAKYPSTPFWVLGGPPCQGFSTAGNKRSMDDQRNSLFVHYKKLLEEVSPDGFVFENVAGLLSMEKGKVFERVKSEFSSVMTNLTGWVLNSEDYAIPQRRKRVILVGSKEAKFKVFPPAPKTSNNKNDLFSDLKSWITVDEAISDLPPISQGENGSHLNYISEPKSDYQRLMRGEISPETYLSYFSN
ncbi:MAG: Alw26I/Eco31I/Esp3I family type II restriction adenine-specific DNA-methyltransferase [Porticoccaceae bacterium]